MTAERAAQDLAPMESRITISVLSDILVHVSCQVSLIEHYVAHCKVLKECHERSWEKCQLKSYIQLIFEHLSDTLRGVKRRHVPMLWLDLLTRSDGGVDMDISAKNHPAAVTEYLVEVLRALQRNNLTTLHNTFARSVISQISHYHHLYAQ